MSLIFEKLEIKNFLSFGNVPQTIDFNRKSYQLVVGLNKDKGESSAERNGTGKSSILNALHFALFGKAIDNRINLPNLVNAINGKNCEVKLYFSKNNIQYIIHRGRAPVFLKLFVNGEDIIEKSQGNNKDTQKEIEEILGFSDEVYNQIFSLSPIVNSFLDQPLQKQRVIIENVLGVNQLTEKAEVLKEKIKEIKQEIKNEQFIIDKLKATNNATINNFKIQRDNINTEFDKWELKKQIEISKLSNKLEELNSINIEEEKTNFKLIQEYNKIENDNKNKEQIVKEICIEIQNINNTLIKYKKELDTFNSINIEDEENIYNKNKSTRNEENLYNEKLKIHENDKKILKDIQNNFIINSKKILKINDELSNIIKNICPFCKQEMDKEESEKMIIQKNDEKKILEEENHHIDLEIMELNNKVQSFVTKTFTYKIGKYSDYESILHYKVNKENIELKIVEYQKKLNENILKAQAPELVPNMQIIKPKIHYNSEREIVEHNMKVNQCIIDLEKLQTITNINPYKMQLDTLSNPPLTDIDEEKVIEMEKTLRHEEILLKLLNSPDSYIRKYIIDTNLQFLNERVKYYLMKMGSLHSVVFNNDMSVTITKMGIEYGYISTGEMSRASLALTLAFRDIWEQLNNPVNLFYIDEVLDRSGLDTAGVELMVSLLKEYTLKGEKNMFLVSHREELISSTDDICTVTMENGFTNLEDN